MNGSVTEPEIELERPLTYHEAAQICRVKYSTIKQWAYDEQVPRYRVYGDNTRLLPASVVRKWLERRLIKCQHGKANSPSEQPS